MQKVKATAGKNIQGISTEQSEAIFDFSSFPMILSRKQVASLLQIGISTLDTRIPPDVLPRIKLGKSVRFLRSDVERYLSKNRIGGNNS